MTSQQTIATKLREIARNHNLSGEGVDAQIGWLSFLFSNYSTEVMNALNESNISTATLMNNKITQCMNVMYSVYRGRNVLLKLNEYTLYSEFSINKYELAYQSNNFYIYANKSFTFNRVSNEPMEFIISTRPKYEVTIKVDLNNRDYIDVKLNDITIGDLSEDIRVLIKDNDESEFYEVNTTRLFYDHINQKSTLTQSQILDQYSDNNLEVDVESKLFALTIPGYGLRLFRKGGFSQDSEVKIECFKYTTKEEIEQFESEVRRIKFENFDMVVDIDLTQTTLTDDQGRPYTQLNNYLEVESPRDNINSSFYNAIAFSHMQSQIMSNIDVDVLFSEFFRDYVESAAHICTEVQLLGSDKVFKIFIYYIPIGNKVITEDMMTEFIKYCKPYYLGSVDIYAILAMKRELEVNIDLYVTENVSLTDSIQSIFSSYVNKLPYLTKLQYLSNGGVDIGSDIETSLPMLRDASILSQNIKRIRAQITSLPSVYYIDKFMITDPNEPNTIGDDYLPHYTIKTADSNVIDNADESLGMSSSNPPQIPAYYSFRLNITYKYNENISR